MKAAAIESMLPDKIDAKFRGGDLPASRWLFVVAVAHAFGCSREPPLVCESAPVEALGTWAVYAPPTYEDPNIGEFPISGMHGSDGAELILLQQSCYTCELVRFDNEVSGWVSSTAERTSPLVIYSYISVSGGYVVSATKDYGLALLDRSSLTWTQLERPPDIPDREVKGWTGEEFVYWGWTQNISGSPQLTSETLLRRHYDGSLLNPETLEWTLIPPFREAYDYTVGEGGPSIASIWTSIGLFVWGTNPERTGTWGATFSRELMSWTDLPSDGELPPLRENHQLLSIGPDVFLYGGNQPGAGEASRRIFEYSLDTGTWREVAVPEWVDPMRGAVVDEKLVFMGSCAGGARFDPKTETWEALAKDGPPPTQGSLLGFGNSVAVIGAEDHAVVTGRVWILDLGG